MCGATKISCPQHLIKITFLIRTALGPDLAQNRGVEREDSTLLLHHICIGYQATEIGDTVSWSSVNLKENKQITRLSVVKCMFQKLWIEHCTVRKIHFYCF